MAKGIPQNLDITQEFCARAAAAPLPALSPVLSAALTDIAKNQKGIFIGEEHNSTEIETFMVDTMSHFKKMGIKTLYIEMGYASDKAVFEDFNNHKVGAEQRLIAARAKNWGNDDDFRGDLIQAARDNGIRVIPIDHERLSENLVDTNTIWASRIEEDQQKHHGKYLVYAGFYHSGDDHFFQNGTRIENPDSLGVDKMLGIPHINYKTNVQAKTQIVTLDGRAVIEPNTTDGQSGFTLVISVKAKDIIDSEQTYHRANGMAKLADKLEMLSGHLQEYTNALKAGDETALSLAVINTTISELKGKDALLDMRLEHIQAAIVQDTPCDASHPAPAVHAVQRTR